MYTKRNIVFCLLRRLKCILADGWLAGLVCKRSSLTSWRWDETHCRRRRIDVVVLHSPLYELSGWLVRWWWWYGCWWAKCRHNILTRTTPGKVFTSSLYYCSFFIIHIFVLFYFIFYVWTECLPNSLSYLTTDSLSSWTQVWTLMEWRFNHNNKMMIRIHTAVEEKLLMMLSLALLLLLLYGDEMILIW